MDGADRRRAVADRHGPRRLEAADPADADVGAILKRLDEEQDTTIRGALLLSLGEFSDEQLPADARSSPLQKLKAIYHNEADPGLHSAAEWRAQRSP